MLDGFADDDTALWPKANDGQKGCETVPDILFPIFGCLCNRVNTGIHISWQSPQKKRILLSDDSETSKNGNFEVSLLLYSAIDNMTSIELRSQFSKKYTANGLVRRGRPLTSQTAFGGQLPYKGSLVRPAARFGHSQSEYNGKFLRATNNEPQATIF